MFYVIVYTPIHLAPKPLFLTLNEETGEVKNVLLSPEKKRILFVFEDYIEIYSQAAEKLLSSREFEEIIQVNFIDEETLLVTEEACIGIYKIDENAELHLWRQKTLDTEFYGSIKAATLSPSLQLFLVQTEENVVLFYQINSREKNGEGIWLRRLHAFKDHLIPDVGSIWNYNSQYFILEDPDGDLKVIDATSIQLHFSFGKKDFKIEWFEWANTQNHLLVCLKFSKLHVWDVETFTLKHLDPDLSCTSQEAHFDSHDVGIAYTGRRALYYQPFRNLEELKKFSNKKMRKGHFFWCQNYPIIICYNPKEEHIKLYETITQSVIEIDKVELDAELVFYLPDEWLLLVKDQEVQLFNIAEAIFLYHQKYITPLRGFLDKPHVYPYIFDEEGNLGQNISKFIQLVKTKGRKLGHIKSIIQNCPNPYKEFYAAVFDEYTTSRWEYEGKLSRACTQLIQRVQTEIDGLKEYLRKNEETLENSRVQELKNKIMLIEMVYFNISKRLLEHPNMEESLLSIIENML